MKNVLIVLASLVAVLWLATGGEYSQTAHAQSCAGFAAAPERVAILRAAPVRTWLANRPQRSVLVGGPRAGGCSGFSAAPRGASCGGFEAVPYAVPRAYSSCGGN